MEKLAGVARLLMVLMLGAGLAGAADVVSRSGPTSAARTAKQHGDQFLSSKRYADAMDCYFQSLGEDPEYPEVHYNLGVVFLKGYRDYGLAAHHFRRYLALDPYAVDREQVSALLVGLEARREPLPRERGVVLRALGQRLLISGAWETTPRELVVNTKDVAGTVLVAYAYSGAVLTERIRQPEVLELIDTAMAVFRPR